MLCRSLLPATMLWVAWFAPAASAEPPLGQIEHKSEVLCAAWSFDGKTLATGCQDGTIRLSDSAGKEVRTINTGAYPVAGIAFSPDGKWVAIRQVGKTLSTWEVATGKAGRTGGFPNYNADQLAFTPDGQNVVATAYGEFVQWRANGGGASGTKWGGNNEGGFAAVAPDGRLCAWSNTSGLVQIQETEPR